MWKTNNPPFHASLSMSEDSTRYIYTHISKNYFFFTSPQCVRTRFALLHSFLSERFFLSTFSLLQKQQKKEKKNRLNSRFKHKKHTSLSFAIKMTVFCFLINCVFPPLFFGLPSRAAAKDAHLGGLHHTHTHTPAESCIVLRKQRSGICYRRERE